MPGRCRDRTGQFRSPAAISTTARRRSTPGPTRSSATSSPSTCSGCEDVMNFDFSEEQQQLRGALARLLDRGYEFDKRKQIVASEAGLSREIWKQLAELGALSIALPEAHGGAGGNAVD